MTYKDKEAREYLQTLTASGEGVFCFDSHHALPCRMDTCTICLTDCDPSQRGDFNRLTLWMLQYLVVEESA